MVVFFVRYVAWHYVQAPALIFQVWKNLLWYLGHVFSVDALWRSLFMPWKRIVAKRTKKWDFEDIASAALANILSRIIGALMRLILITIGRLSQLAWLFTGLILYISWFFLPLLIMFTFVYGLIQIL